VTDDHLHAMTVEFEELTPAQVIALRKFFGEWDSLVTCGATRPIGFFVDGDGAMRSVPSVDDDLYLEDEELLAEAKDAVKSDEARGLFDPDGAAWVLDEPVEVEEP